MTRTFALSVAALAIAFALTPPLAAADPTEFAIGKCFDPSVPAPQRPVKFDYNCDGTGVMDDMAWTSWGADGARGTGIDNSIWCNPNCAQGPLITNPIIVHAWNPLSPSGSPCPSDVQFYSDLTIAYPKGAPPWIIPGTTWDDGTVFLLIDGMPAVQFSDLKPNCLPR